MGRKPVPQPLSLGNLQSGSGLHAHLGSGPSSGNSNYHGSAVSPGALTSSAPNSSTLGSQGRRSPHIAGASADLSLHIPATTNSTSSSSPRSPRSPYSKFNTSSTKQGDTRQVHTSHGLSPSHLHPKFTPQPSPEIPSFDYKLGPVTDARDQDYNFPRSSPRSNPSEGKQSSQGQHALTHSRSHTDGAKPHKPNFNLQREEEKHTRSASSRFWNFNKSTKPAHHQRVNTRDLQRNREPAPNQRPNDGNSSGSEAMSRGSDRANPSDRMPSKSSKPSDSIEQFKTSQASRSDLSLPESETASSKKGKPKQQFALLGRNRSLKEDYAGPGEMSSEVRIQEPERSHALAGHQPLRVAPIDKDNLNDRHLRHMKNSSSSRNNSSDRQRDVSNKDSRPDKDQNRSHPSSFKDSSGSTFFGNLKSSGSRAADMFSSRFFGNKSSRSASTTEKENTVDDEHYQLKVINLPLVQQVRKTRISKKLEDARDKTEFWMPAFPWRAIDYLNYKGSDVEGLYRVPGSGPQIKKWQRKFDEKFDVDLFAQDDLYDINIIGSMLKAWLRELPDELFPKSSQERIARECVGAETVPPMLIEELSNLPPYNYYLLFAITCHLSLLLAHSEKNRMDFRNLCICFQPCLKIDAFCFKFLVCEWRDCWKGCKNEGFYIEEEYALMQQPPPASLSVATPIKTSRSGSPTRGNSNASRSRSERGPSMDDQSGRSLEVPRLDHDGTGLQKTPSAQNGSVNSISTGLSVGSHQEPTRNGGADLRPLSPIKPLSPLGF